MFYINALKQNVSKRQFSRTEIPQTETIHFHRKRAWDYFNFRSSYLEFLNLLCGFPGTCYMFLPLDILWYHFKYELMALSPFVKSNYCKLNSGFHSSQTKQPSNHSVLGSRYYARCITNIISFSLQRNIVKKCVIVPFI